MKILDAAATRAPLRDMARLVSALRQAFVEGATVPLRHVHQLGSGTEAGTC